MTQEEIRKKRIQIEATLNDLKEKFDKLAVELNDLRRKCMHPSVLVGEYDNYEYCQDCGAIN
ncbi:MAG: hypothetical protein HZA36_02025 [Parcubacteria group bacterium]|nr:hypothetical protein [Parcubacteria group bacterium]